MCAASRERTGCVRYLSDSEEGCVGKTYFPVSELTVLNPGDSTVFTFPDAGVSSTSFRYFASLASGDFTVIGMEPKGLIRGQKPFESIAQAVKCYANEIIQLFPEGGNIHLVGYSFGSILAFATAGVLEEQYIKIKSLSLLDPPNPIWSQIVPSEMTLLWSFVESLSDRLSCPIEPSLEQALSKEPPYFFSALHEWLVVNEALPEGVDTAVLSAQYNTYKAAHMASFRPSVVYKNPSHILLSTSIDRQQRVGLWSNYLASMTISDARTSHQDMLVSPHVASVYRIWRNALETHLDSNRRS